MIDLREHWQSVYTEKAPEEVSWFQREPELSHSLVTRAAESHDARIVDVGGGASTLVDMLLASGYRHISVLDLANASLDRAQARLGAKSMQVTWMAADVLSFAFPSRSVDVWHDRAVFHFLTRAEDREQYVAQVKRAVRPGGHVLVATFAEDGPTRCSGLSVARYTSAQLHGVFGPGFVLEESARETHTTPSGANQPFTYCLCRWEPELSERVAA